MGLFAGVSLLSLVEMAIWTCKLLITAIGIDCREMKIH